jgi:phosphatidylglycerophosphatase A
MLVRLAYLIATWFGCGFWPKGPGTAGSLGALLFIVLVSWGRGWTPWQCLLAAGLLLLPSVWAAHTVARHRGVEDPQIVVVDEVIGQWLALTGAREFSWTQVALAFVLFRLFDIFKPPPVRQLERVPGGWGIILDDVMAGLYAALVLWGWGWFNRG